MYLQNDATNTSAKTIFYDYTTYLKFETKKKMKLKGTLNKMSNHLKANNYNKKKASKQIKDF